MTWPDVDFRLAFLLAKSPSEPLRSVSLVHSPDQAGTPIDTAAALRSDETAVLVLLDEAALLEIHPQVDLEGLARATHRPAVSECATRRTLDDTAEAPFPSTAVVYAEVEGRLTLVPEPASLLARAGRLSLPIANQPCDSGLEARRFGDDWSVLAETLTLDGRTFRRDTAGDTHAFQIFAAQYLDDDRLVLGLGHAVVVLERGQILSSNRGPFYWSLGQLPVGEADPVWVAAVMVDPIVRPGGVRRVAASINTKTNEVPLAHLAVFEVSEVGISLISTTTVAGELGEFHLDAEGRIIGLVAGNAAPEVRGRVLAVLGAADRFELFRLSTSFRSITTTEAPAFMHVGLTQEDRLVVGDLLDPDGWRTLRDSSDGAGEREGVTAVHDGRTLHVFLGSAASGVLHVRDDGTSRGLPVFLDSEVSGAGCVSPTTTCGYPSLASAPSRLWSARGARGLALAVASTKCEHVVAAPAESGCFGLLNVGAQPIGFEDRALSGVYGRPGHDQALVIGSSGTAFELFVKEPAR